LRNLTSEKQKLLMGEKNINLFRRSRMLQKIKNKNNTGKIMNKVFEKFYLKFEL